MKALKREEGHKLQKLRSMSQNFVQKEINLVSAMFRLSST